MEWKRTLTGMPVAVQLLEDNRKFDLDLEQNPEAGENFIHLAQLAAWKGFARLGLPYSMWQSLGEDAVQESLCLLLQTRHKSDYTPRLAYYTARQCSVRWFCRHALGLLERNLKEFQSGIARRAPVSFSLDDLEWEPRLHGEGLHLHPDEVEREQERAATREAQVTQFYDIVHDLVVNHIRPHMAHRVAANDAELFEMTLQGQNAVVIAEVMGCRWTAAKSRRTLARARLLRLLETHGLETVAGWYTDVARGERTLPNARAQIAFVDAQVQARATAYHQTHGVTPQAHKYKIWKRAARFQWEKQDRRARQARQLSAMAAE
jgi:hypothetical protein